MRCARVDQTVERAAISGCGANGFASVCTADRRGRRDVAFLSSTSVGFSVVASILARGVREVVTLERSFHRQRFVLNAGIGFARSRAKMELRGRGHQAACTEKTGAIAVSIVQFASGFRVDLDAVRAIARTRKLALCLNAAQAIGHVPIDVAGADFMCGACHKWLMAGYGAAFFYAKPDWLSELPLSGWLSVDESVRWQTFGGAAIKQEARARARREIVHEAPSLKRGHLGSIPDRSGDRSAGLGPGRSGASGAQAMLRDGLRARGFARTRPTIPRARRASPSLPSPIRSASFAPFATRGSLAPRARRSDLTHVYNDASDDERLLSAWDAQDSS
jgi:hypothetical protein